jgi:ribonuclease III
VDRQPRAPERDLITSLDTLASLLDELPDDLAKQVFTHASWVDRRADSYERLAFLGDVVLSLAVSTAIYPRFENYGAGRLTKLRAQAVSEQACVEVARSLGIPERIESAAPAGVGRNADVLVDSDRVLASVCEAVIGAAYLAFGIDRVQPAVVAAFEGQIEDARKNPVDHKSVLQERLAQRSEVVDYVIDSEAGPPHDRSFVAVAQVAGEEIGRGEGKTKKAAEQEAAERALDRLDDDEQES